MADGSAEVEKKALSTLFSNAEAAYPERLRSNGWYLTVIASLVGTNRAHHVGALYKHMISQQSYTRPEERQKLVRRMREALVKCIILNGIPRVMIAVASLAREENAMDQDWFFSRKDWVPNNAIEKRANDHLTVLYKGDDHRITSTFGSHEDIQQAWISTNISYGLFLSDHRILSLLETELVVLPAIMTQNLREETYWHLRGSLRAGIRRAEVERLQQVIEMVASFAGVKLDNVQRVADVDDE